MPHCFFQDGFHQHAAVLDQLCNHKQAIGDWSTSNPAICCCKSWSSYKSAALNPSADHWVLSGSLLHSALPPELAVVAEGSLSNKVFPSKKEHLNQMKLGLKTWTKKNGLPHASVQHLWPLPPSLVRTHPENHQSHYEVLHHSTSVHLWRRHLPLRGQKSILSTHLLSMLVLTFHWTNLPRSFDLWTATWWPILHRQLPYRISSTPTRQSIPLGSGLWSRTSSRLYFGQTEERLSQRQTHHLLCWVPFSAYAQHPCPYDLPTHSGCLSKPCRRRGCLHFPSWNRHLSMQTSFWSTRI